MARKELQRVADALWQLRGSFNAGVADPAKPSTTFEAEILASFASYVSCAADDTGFNEDTFEGLHCCLREDIARRGL